MPNNSEDISSAVSQISRYLRSQECNDVEIFNHLRGLRQVLNDYVKRCGVDLALAAPHATVHKKLRGTGERCDETAAFLPEETHIVDDRVVDRNARRDIVWLVALIYATAIIGFITLARV
jgi:hypothetical protein